MDQLKKALKTADVCMTKPENLYLLVKLLNTYVYFFSVDAEFMTSQDINDLLRFIKDTIDEMEDQGPAQSSLKFFENTKAAIRVKVETNSKFSQILV